MTKHIGKVGVLYGGNSSERAVSLQSGQGVYEALRQQGIDAHLFDLGEKTVADLVEQHFDQIFIALHGRFGEDGCVQGLLELLGIPYTGSGVMASALAMNKILTKQVLLHHGIPTPDYAVVESEAALYEAQERLGLPLIVKPPHEGSTLGLKKVSSIDDIPAAFALSHTYEQALLVEKCIIGRELTVAILGQGETIRALPIIEIMAPEGNYDFEHKYLSDDTKYCCPAPLSEDLQRRIEQYCLRAYQLIGCEGWARVDVMLDQNEQPWVLEINTSPGMTSHSLVPMAAKEVGMTYADLCVFLLDQARTKVFKK